jgi:hypothetical protein
VQIGKFDDDEVSLQVSGHELAAISNSLNAVCHGLRVADFEAKMGAKRGNVEQKLDEILDCYDKMEEQGLTEGIVSFSNGELRMIIGALKEVCREIEDWEIPIRIGAEVDEIDEILVELITVYQKMAKLGA